MRLKAELLPLEGKYYGSRIEVSVNGESEWIIVWCNLGNYNPSEREYDEAIGDKFFLVDEDGERWEYEISDNHYESQTAYEISKAIVKAIDGLEITA